MAAPHTRSNRVPWRTLTVAERVALRDARDAVRDARRALLAAIANAYDSGVSQREIADATGYSKDSISTLARRHRGGASG